MRSLTSHFKWVTCPAVLERMKADYRRLGKELDFKIPSIQANQAWILEKGKNDNLFLEELRFNLVQETVIEKIIEKIRPLMASENSQERLQRQFVLISDDHFKYLSQYATPVVPHTQLSEQKTSENLWYEESLPPDTLLYSSLLMHRSRTDDNTADQLMKAFTQLVDEKQYIQVGGNETTGMGWCRMTLL